MGVNTGIYAVLVFALFLARAAPKQALLNNVGK
jgi:hypothetical protein